MKYEFKIFYIIKEGHCFQSGLDLQNCGCQDHEDTIDLRLHMLLRFVRDSERMFKSYSQIQGQRWRRFQKFLIIYFLKRLTRVVSDAQKKQRILLPALGEQQREETGVQVTGTVTWSEWKGARMCFVTQALCVYIHICLYLHTKVKSNLLK